MQTNALAALLKKEIKDNGRLIRGWQFMQKQLPERRRDKSLINGYNKGKLSQLINKGKSKLGQLESKRNEVKALMIDNECAVEV